MRAVWVFSLVGLVASCSASNSGQAIDEARFLQPKALADQAGKDAQSYAQMARACEVASFDAFLTIFANSPTIQESYSARQIAYHVGKKTTLVGADEYNRFPFTRAKDAWIGASGFAVAVRAQDQQANPVIVNWSHKLLDPTATYTESQIKMAQEKGQLEFRFAKGCWRLMSDRRA
jgi:hypothetical protein